MPISKQEEKMINLQHQLRQNNTELQDYLADLDNWENDIKRKEQQLKTERSNESADLPPVRNTIHKKKLKKKKKEKTSDPNKPKRISGYDFRAWDKFDADKALQEMDKDDKKETSSSEYETDEEWEMERKKHLAGTEKEKGNDFLKKGDYDKAVEAYTKGMELDATNAILPANRALAFIKQQRFAAAELDCTTSISLDPLYVKAYLRRATARAGMGKLDSAVSDYRRVLDLEPNNKQAEKELDRLNKEMERPAQETIASSLTEGEKGLVKPVYKPPDERSKAPLRRIAIEEIGLEPSNHQQSQNAQQSEVAKRITDRESEQFDKLLASSVSSSSTSLLLPMAQSQHMPRESSLPSSASVNGEKHENKTSGVENGISGTDREELGLGLKSSSTATPASMFDQAFLSSSSPSTGEQSKSSAPAGKSNISTGQQEEKGATDKLIRDQGSGDRFNVPSTSFQFQADFKLLKNKPESFYQYFRVISPSQFPKLFGQCLDADILNAILKSLAQFSHGDINVYTILDGLTKVKRFSMTAMFLSKKEKEVVQDLIHQLTSHGDQTDAEIAALKNKYCL